MIRFVDPSDFSLDDLLDVESVGSGHVVTGGRTKAKALERFAETLGFPDWFGRNLDALYELLDEHAHRATASGRDWTLVWAPSRRLVTEHPSDYARLLAVLADVAGAGPSYDGVGRRVVLIHGSEPASDRHRAPGPPPEPNTEPNTDPETDDGRPP